MKRDFVDCCWQPSDARRGSSLVRPEKTHSTTSVSVEPCNVPSYEVAALLGHRAGCRFCAMAQNEIQRGF